MSIDHQFLFLPIAASLLLRGKNNIPYIFLPPAKMYSHQYNTSKQQINSIIFTVYIPGIIHNVLYSICTLSNPYTRKAEIGNTD